MYGYGQQIIQVTGEEGARTYQMPPNSSALLLDSNDPIVWVVQTDGAGYKSIRPFKIEPYTPPTPVNLNDILDRLERIEEKINEPDPKPKRTTKSTDTE